MQPIPVDLAVEDEISAHVAQRLLRHCNSRFHLGTIHQRGGFGYLRSRIQGWNLASPSRPILVLTDLDVAPCAGELLSDWLGGQPLQSNCLLRIAVREIEAWILGDWDEFLSYLRIARGRARNLPAPLSTEAFVDPKRELLRLAALSRHSDTRKRLLPALGSTATQGPEYNACLGEFVDDGWDPERASRRNASLLKAIQRLRSFEPWRET